MNNKLIIVSNRGRSLPGRLHKLLERRLEPQRVKVLGILIACAFLLAGVSGGLAYVEYRTNLFAKWIGEALADTNAYRRRAGSLWQQLRARAQVREALDHTTPAEGVPDGALPAAVADGRFQVERVPVSGMPTFLAVWRTPVAGGTQRAMPEVVESMRTYRLGLALLQAARLPDVRYRAQVQERVRAVFREAGDFEWAGEDSATVPPDSVAATVREALAGEFTAQLREKEIAVLLRQYEAGEVGQVLVQRGVGVYHGTLSYQDPTVPEVSFELMPGQVAEILGVAVVEGER